MNKKEHLNTIKEYLPFAVVQEERKEAEKLLNKYSNNEIILRLLYEYYTNLPDTCEEAVIQVSELNSKYDVHLFVLICKKHSWLYLINTDTVLLIGTYRGDREDMYGELIEFFGYSSQKEFLKNCPSVEELEEYPAEEERGRCPACGAGEGEVHLIGCVVEICPWCNGQLHSCNCRFEKLGVDEIEDEEQLEDFVELLEEKGRIVYQQSHSPAYPGTSCGLDTGSGE